MKAGLRKKFTRLYYVHQAMIGRCYRKTNKSYPRYGGRGISVDYRWMGRDGFKNFLEDMGDPPLEYTLDRIDNDGPYCKTNCRWATRTEQNNNTSHNVRITYNGETLTLTEWARRLGTRHTTIWHRIKRSGWTAEEAVSTPVGCNRRLTHAATSV